jgi:mono/diheme cytochrome c family protein
MKYFLAVALGFFLLFHLISACNEQSYRAGERLYKKNCSNCHLDDGKGVGALIPPLAGSDF